MNRVRLYLHRLFRRPAVTGPYRVYVRRIPTGVMLDVEHYLTAVVETLADNDDLMELLKEIKEDRQEARSHKHDGWEPEELLVENLCTALGYELPVYGDRVAKLGKRLLSAAPKPKPETGAVVQLPGQRQAGAA